MLAARLGQHPWDVAPRTPIEIGHALQVPDAAILELDHVLLAVNDLAVAARLLSDRHGLASADGGRHDAWGTANRIVPLGDAYLELIAVVDDDRACASPFGRWVSAAGAAPLRPLGWAVRTRALDDVARRLGLPMSTGTRARPDGILLHWRLAGLERAIADPSLPFFIEWADGTPHPGRAPGTTEPRGVRVIQVHVHGDAAKLSTWLDGAHLPVAVRPGVPGVAAVTLSGVEGEFTIDASLQ